MRKLMLLLFLPLATIDCSSNDCGGCMVDSGTDVTTSDATTDAKADVQQADVVNDVSTTDASDGGIVLGCTSPASCDAGAPVCCGSIVLTGGTPPACTIGSVTATCKTGPSCPSTFAQSCTATETVRFCAQPSDCTETTYDKCCTFQEGNQSFSICTSSTIAQAAGATCM